MVFIAKQHPFTCKQCDTYVENLQSGSYRNHCPECLYSVHVDQHGPGDRLATCQGLMQPIGLDQSNKKGYIVIHKCKLCGKISRNKAAPDDKLEKITPNIFE